MSRLGILGVGKMGASILEGVANAKIYSKKDIYIYTPNLEHQQKYKALGYNILENELKLFEIVDIILLAIKPQMFPTALKDAKGIDYTNKCIISIAAGISISKVLEYFNNATVVRAMPNTPALIQEASTTICSNHKNSLVIEAKKIFSSIGNVEEIEESLMDETLPLNGSMPAYLYLFAKAFIDHSSSLGIDYEISKKICCNAIIGSAKMILESKDSIDTLIQNVCSKGGTTIAGLNELCDKDFVKSIDACYTACVNRAKELNK